MYLLSHMNMLMVKAINLSLIVFLTLTSTIAKEVKVNTTSGVVLGQTIIVLNQTVNQFLGIPYAEPPIGDLRFAKPKPIEKPFQDVIDSTKPKNACFQNNLNLPQSEDCLLVNIWSPDSTQLKPVMFFIHGGGLLSESIFKTVYNGSALATNDIVFVSVAYRLGFFGYIYGGDESAPGNVGFYDQVLALQWVRDNIHLFGGDKNEITIFGQSAGSWSVSAHILSPMSRGLFKRAILESGALLFNKKKVPSSKHEALAVAKQFSAKVNCTDDQQWLNCLRQLTPQQIVEAQPTDTVLFLVEDNEFLPLTSQKAFEQGKFNKDIDIIAGITRDEGSAILLYNNPSVNYDNLTEHDFEEIVSEANSLFHDINVTNVIDFYLDHIDTSDSNAIKWKLFDFNGDIHLKCPTFLFAKRYAEHSTNKSKTFFYQLDYIPEYLEGFTKLEPIRVPASKLGVYHGLDIAFVFGIPLLFPNWKSDTDIRFSREVMKMWTNFAKYGKPSDEWKPLLTGNDNFHDVIRVFNPNQPNEYYIDLFQKSCDGFWKNYF